MSPGRWAWQLGCHPGRGPALGLSLVLGPVGLAVSCKASLHSLLASPMASSTEAHSYDHPLCAWALLPSGMSTLSKGASGGPQQHQGVWGFISGKHWEKTSSGMFPDIAESPLGDTPRLPSWSSLWDLLWGGLICEGECTAQSWVRAWSPLSLPARAEPQWCTSSLSTGPCPGLGSCVILSHTHTHGQDMSRAHIHLHIHAHLYSCVLTFTH